MLKKCADFLSVAKTIKFAFCCRPSFPVRAHRSIILGILDNRGFAGRGARRPELRSSSTASFNHGGYGHFATNSCGFPSRVSTIAWWPLPRVQVFFFFVPSEELSFPSHSSTCTFLSSVSTRIDYINFLLFCREDFFASESPPSQFVGLYASSKFWLPAAMSGSLFFFLHTENSFPSWTLLLGSFAAVLSLC
jgi:hypothetical protein